MPTYDPRQEKYFQSSENIASFFANIPASIPWKAAIEEGSFRQNFADLLLIQLETAAAVAYAGLSVAQTLQQASRQSRRTQSRADRFLKMAAHTQFQSPSG